MKRVLVSASALLLAFVFLSQPAMAQIEFNKVQTRTSLGSAEEGDKGNLVVDSETVRFTDKKGAEHFSLPVDSIDEIYYSRVSGRRIKTAVFVSPAFFFLKGRKHYVTLTFADGDHRGAVELKLDKNNYRGVLRSLEQVTDLAVHYDQEGIKDTAQDISTHDPALHRAAIAFSSNPDGAEIEIDGVYAGSTPRAKTLDPGGYVVRVTKPGFETWEREILVESGEAVNVFAELSRRD